MQRWQYLYVVADSSKLFQLRVHYVNGSEVKNWEHGPRIHEYFNRWGGEGWELVSARDYDYLEDEGNRLVYREALMIFKRPQE
jgi:hypothetical protein